jgi:hypothetical protein
VSTGFDGSAYRQRVLAVLRRRAPLSLDDPFFVADVDPAEPVTDGDVQAHLARVVAFLQRERNSAKYASLAAELVRRRAEWEAPLLDAATREAARDRVVAARRSGDAERLAKVDGYLATVRERFGGIPASRVAGLRRLAEAAGVGAAEFDARLRREHVIADGVAGGVEPLAPEVRRQIRERLDELRALCGGDRVTTGSLWGLLELPADADPDRIGAAYELLAERNLRRPRDREKTVTADLLAIVVARLVDGDPRAYTASVLADAADDIRPAVEEHVVLDGELTPTAYEGLVRQLLASGRGLSAGQSRAVVLEVARSLGAAVNTGAVVDYVVCTNCGRPEPVGGGQVCRYCDTDLYTACPTCGRSTEAAAVVCRQCGTSLRQSRQAAAALAAIRRAVEDGRPRQAALALDAARPLLAVVGAPVVGVGDDLSARVQAALGAADAGWRALTEDVEAHRTDAAADGARWLAAQAADVPGPDGRTAAEVLAELTAHQNVIRRRVEAAQALPEQAREAALAAVLTTAADSREALAALAALPLAPPSELTAAACDGAVLLRWRASTSIGNVSYRVVRLIEAVDADGPARRSLGTTRATELSDAGVPIGVAVRHEVTAVSGGRASPPVCTPGIVLVRDVADLHAEQTADGVLLTWRLDGPLDMVTVERSTAAGSPGQGGPTRRTRAVGGRLVDQAVQPGLAYEYQVFVEYRDADGRPARTAGAAATVDVAVRPAPVLDLAAATASPPAAPAAPGASAAAAGRTTLRWTAPGGADVRVYAVPGESGPEAFGPENGEVDVSAADGRARLVGTSRRGRLADPAAAGELVYVPVTVFAEPDGRPAPRGIVGRPVRHVAVGGVRDLRADDRGDEIVLSFQLPPGVAEARVLWRRDRPPAGPDDPEAARATVTNGSLEIKGGWRLSAPRDGWAYHVAVYPLYRFGGRLRAAPAGAVVSARLGSRADTPPPLPPLPPAAGARTPAAGTRLPPAAPAPASKQTGDAGAGGAPAEAAAPGPATPAAGTSTAAPQAVAGAGAAAPEAAPVAVPAGTATAAAAPATTAAVAGSGVAGSAVAAPAGTGPGATTVEYSVGRSGWWRRTLRVNVHADGPTPELLLVAKSGAVPPDGADDGHAVSRLAPSPSPSSHTIEVSLDGAALPWGVRLVPAVGAPPTAVEMHHPPDAVLVIR